MELTEAQRAFLDRVDAVAFANPFSADRTRIDSEFITASIPAGSRRGEEVAEKIDAFLQSLGGKGNKGKKWVAPPFTAAVGRDERRLFIAHLFVAYHRLTQPFDELLEAMRECPDKPPAVTFAAEAIRDLRARGFHRERAIRAFTIFWQLHRASRLIDENLPGSSGCMQTLRGELWQALFSSNILYYETHLWNRMEDFSILLLGETGTGKGVAAQALGGGGYIPFNETARVFKHPHRKQFLGLNLSQFPETLIESELFGHRKGAFTGAIADQGGAFQACRPHGVLFLDEIGDVSVQVQIKLLRVLQDRCFTPVGSTDELPFRGRVVAATHRDLDQLRTEGDFRDDFYYRLCSNEIVVPPLRERLAESPDELGQLLCVILERMTGETDPGFLLDVLKQDLPPDYAWPGNVRELQQAVRRILLTGHYRGDQKPVGGDDLSRAIRSGEMTLRELSAAYCQSLYQQCGSYEEVARRAEIDRRTAKKHVETGRGGVESP